MVDAVLSDSYSWGLVGGVGLGLNEVCVIVITGDWVDL